jgi:hypothetical protein
MKPIRLTELPSILHAVGYSERSPYHTTYTAVLDGEFPAQPINRIWRADMVRLISYQRARVSAGLQRYELRGSNRDNYTF